MVKILKLPPDVPRRRPDSAAFTPMVAFGLPLFDAPDDADGAVVNGIRLWRGPDGTLVGYGKAPGR